jgi:ATP-dependent helicase HrpB
MAVLLPISAHKAAIQAAIACHPVTIISAPPGTGKTTQVPQYLLETVRDHIYVLQPRRLAAMLTAQRIAEERNGKLGGEIGYWIRHDRCVSDGQTRCTFLTEGMFMRILQSNPTLRDVSTVIIDEFHERNLNTDLAVAMTRLIMQENKKVRLVIMSATLDLGALQAYFGNAHQIVGEAQTFPVDVHYLPVADLRRNLEGGVVQALQQAMTKVEEIRNTLVFLPGMGEIMRVHTRLMQDSKWRDFSILPLSSTVRPDEQRLVFAPSNRRKIILSTNVAETSLTVPDVNIVIDAGLAKISSFAPWSGMPTLETRPVSQASAIQRAGRAGRTCAGSVFRLYGQDDFLRRPAHTDPEIMRSDLSSIALQLLGLTKQHVWGLTDLFENVNLPTTPKVANVESAWRALSYAGLVDEKGMATASGLLAADWPIHPRLASSIIHQSLDADKFAVIELVSFLHENAAEAFRGQGYQPLNLYDVYQKSRTEAGRTKMGRRLTDAIGKTRDRLLRECNLNSTKGASHSSSSSLLAKALLKGHFDRVAKLSEREQGRAVYHLTQGGGAVLTMVGDDEPSEFIIIFDARERLGADKAKALEVSMWFPISKESLTESQSPFLQESVKEEIVGSSGAHIRYRVMNYGEFEISRERIHEPNSTPSDSTKELLLNALRRDFPSVFSDDFEWDQYLARRSSVAAVMPDLQAPEMSGEMFELFLHSIADSFSDLKSVKQAKLRDLIIDAVGANAWSELQSLAPESVKLRNGKTFTISYSTAHGPLIGGHIQDFYGIADLPKIANGRLGLLIEFMGPNKRPVQRTADLRGFWQKTFPELRKEYLRNYPRHHWAENPLEAPPLLLKRHLEGQ